MNAPNTPELDPLAPRIEDAMRLLGMTQTAFGYKYFGDPAFVKKMREGRRFRRKMVAKVEDMLKEIGL